MDYIIIGLVYLIGYFIATIILAKFNSDDPEFIAFFWPMLAFLVCLFGPFVLLAVSAKYLANLGVKTEDEQSAEENQTSSL